MQRRRRNDPAGVSDNPILVSDPLREAAVIARFKCGLGYIEKHYLIAKRFGLDKRTFNESLARLQVAVACPRQVDVPESRLGPVLEIAISKRARELALHQFEIGPSASASSRYA